MITLTRIVMLVGSRDLDADTAAYHDLVGRINKDLRKKFNGAVTIVVRDFERGSLSLNITAPQAATAQRLLQQIVRCFCELQEDRFRNVVPPIGAGRTHLAVLAVLTKEPDRTFTAEELSALLGVTISTVNRALRKLLSEQKVAVEGLCKTKGHGYGARMFRLT